MNFSLDGDVDQIWGLYQKVNKLINKHAPLKIPSAHIKRNLSKPWITKGLRRSIKVKNNLMMAGDRDAYKLYRNKLTNLIRLSKKLYFHNFFDDNINNIKSTVGSICTVSNARLNF